MKAYSYIAYSTKKQRHGDSIRRQEAFRDKMLKKYKATLDKDDIFIDDGASRFRDAALTKGRLGVFVRAVRAGLIERGSLLIIEAWDRLSRQEAGDQLSLLIELLNAGLIIVCATPRTELTKASINDLGKLVGVMAEMSRGHSESRVKSYRGRKRWRGKRQKARRDGVPYGQHLPHWIRREQGRLVVVNEKAAEIAEFANLVIEGYGLKRAADEMTARHKKSVNHRKGLFAAASYYDILINRSLIGEKQPTKRGKDGIYRPIGTPIADYYPRVLTNEQFDAVQSALRKRRTSHGRQGACITNLFTGLLWDYLSRARLKCIGGSGGFVKGARNPHRVALSNEQRQQKTVCGYQAVETLVRETLAELRDGDGIASADANAGAVELAGIGERVAECQRSIAALKARIASAPEDAIADLSDALTAVAVRRADLLRRQRELEGIAEAKQGRTLVEWVDLTAQEVKAEPSERYALRVRLKEKALRLIEAIWVRADRIRRGKYAIHLQIYMRDGRRVYARAIPDDAPSEYAAADYSDEDWRAG